MTYPDPFAAASADATAEAPTETPTETQEAPITSTAPVTNTIKTASADAEGKVVLTFKGGTGYDAPWIVIHAADLQDAHDSVTGDNASLLAATMERVQTAGKHFSGMAPTKSSGGSAGGGGGAPAAAQSAPGGETRHCAHGEMVFKSGVSKAGKPYKLFSCTAPRDQQCKAQFLN